jgi:hypothetical protein
MAHKQLSKASCYRASCYREEKHGRGVLTRMPYSVSSLENCCSILAGAQVWMWMWVREWNEPLPKRTISASGKRMRGQLMTSWRSGDKDASDSAACTRKSVTIVALIHMTLRRPDCTSLQLFRDYRIRQRHMHAVIMCVPLQSSTRMID